MRIRPPAALALLALSALILTGCSSDDGRFTPGAEDEITCMEHQEESPGTAYTGGAEGETAAILQVFRYYVANGEKPYCDDEPPSETDKEWAQLVVDLGGSKASVSAILD